MAADRGFGLVRAPQTRQERPVGRRFSTTAGTLFHDSPMPLMAKYPNDEACLAHLGRIRWLDDPH